MAFAHRYPTESEVSNAIRHFGSWFAFVNAGREGKERQRQSRRQVNAG